MAKKKKHESTIPPFINYKILKEQGSVYKKWRAGRDAYLIRMELLRQIKTMRLIVEKYKKRKLDQLFSTGMGYSPKEYQKKVKKEIKAIEAIKKESAALLKDLEEII